MLLCLLFCSSQTRFSDALKLPWCCQKLNTDWDWCDQWWSRIILVEDKAVCCLLRHLCSQAAKHELNLEDLLDIHRLKANATTSASSHVQSSMFDNKVAYVQPDIVQNQQGTSTNAFANTDIMFDAEIGNSEWYVKAGLHFGVNWLLWSRREFQKSSWKEG